MIPDSIFVAVVVGAVVGTAVALVMSTQGRRGSIYAGVLVAMGVAFGLYLLVTAR